MDKTSIDLSNSYWGPAEFRRDIKRLRSLVTLLLANCRDDLMLSPSEIGYCLSIFEMLQDEELVDCRKQQ